MIHSVASINEDMMYVITAYIPNPDKWEEGFKERRILNEMYEMWQRSI